MNLLRYNRLVKILESEDGVQRLRGIIGGGQSWADFVFAVEDWKEIYDEGGMSDQVFLETLDMYLRANGESGGLAAQGLSQASGGNRSLMPGAEVESPENAETVGQYYQPNPLSEFALNTLALIIEQPSDSRPDSEPRSSPSSS